MEALESEVLSHVVHLDTAAFRLTRDRAAAESLVLEACRSVARRARGAEVRIGLFSALYRHAPERALFGEAGPAAPVVDPEGKDDGRYGSGAEPLRAALDALPDDLWHPLWLRDIQCFTYAEIARLLGLSPREVLARVSCARGCLRVALRPEPEAGAV